MPLDPGRVTHLIDQMHRSEDDAGDPIAEGMLLAADGARGQEWIDPSTIVPGSMPAADVTIVDAGGFFTATDVEGALQELAGGLDSIPTAPYGLHAHIVSETHLSNGSATTYTLDQAIEPGTVIAWNTTTLARLGVTEAQPDQATVSAAGSSGDSIVFDYATPIVT